MANAFYGRRLRPNKQHTIAVGDTLPRADAQVAHEMLAATRPNQRGKIVRWNRPLVGRVEEQVWCISVQAGLDRINKVLITERFVRNYMAPPFIACTLRGTCDDPNPSLHGLVAPK